MAEVIILSALTKEILRNLNSLTVHEFRLVWHLNKDLKQMESTLSTIQSVLRDAEEKQGKNETIQNWLRNLKDVAYDADDALDEFATQKLRWEVEFQKRTMSKVRYFLSFKPIRFNFKMGHTINKIRRTLDDIAAEKSKFHLIEAIVDRTQGMRGQRQQSSSLLVESEVLGRDRDRESLVQLLVSEGKDEKVSVIPIVGMGGIGKTTLSQLVYNDERVKQHFEIRMWICVSDDFNVSRLTKEIIESATKKGCELLSLDLLQSNLQEFVSGKKFLLVLDDVWCESKEAWEQLKLPMACNLKGSKVIVTTRSKTVASIMGTLVPHSLAILSDDDCWSLFERHAFEQGEAPNHPYLVQHRRHIVKKCGGVPLAAKSLGSVMRSKRDARDWLAVINSEFGSLRKDKDLVLNVLRLSYHHLPTHLKQCFAYCSIFPKDHKIVKGKLMKQWVALGFVESSDKSKLEDIAGDYFDELVRRSLFEEVKENHTNNTIECKMHDLVHDLATSVAGVEYSTVKHGSLGNFPALARHCSLVSDSMALSPTLMDIFGNAKKVRTLLCLFMCHKISIDALNNLFLGMTHLRVLDLSCTSITNLPLPICNLQHLRYLDLSGNPFKELPELICTLLNLQTLILSNCTNLHKLPKDMHKLISLRHLDINRCWSLTHMPSYLGQLSSLQTLPVFIVGEAKGCGLGELHDLNLQGEVNIKNLENVRNVAEAKKANLQEKQNLHSLVLSWSSGRGDDLEEILEGLFPHQNLQRLRLMGYWGIQFPRWMGDSVFASLISISLIRCSKCDKLPVLGQLPQLKELYLSGMSTLQKINIEFYGDGTNKGFPSLKELTISQMPNLEEWPVTNVERLIFPYLARLTINECPKLATLPRCPSLQHLELITCNEMICQSVANLTSLTYLGMYHFYTMLSLPEGMLSNHNQLRSLRIHACGITALPTELENLVSLKSVKVHRCRNLITVSKSLLHLVDISW